jgi:hypothetical protein
MAAASPLAAINANHRLISPGLLEAMMIPVKRGRPFTRDDRDGGQRVAIVIERLARRFWPGADPIGRRFRAARPGAPWLTVVGVAGEVSDSHDPGVPAETFYLPLAQNATSPAAEKIYLMVRTGGDPLALVGPVRRAAARVDRTLPLYDPAAMDRYLSDSLGRERVGALFMLCFGAFGLALAALGVYGVVAFGVARRTPEFGIRMALGAQPRDIVPLVLRQSAGEVGAGLGIGAVAAWAVNRVVASLLEDGAIADTRVLIVAMALIASVAVIASWLPARRASGIDPVRALS